ncbi:MAG TPA: hypothetical protein VJU61_14770 [Polyangiaceae bacterium]|nr:hypothetical protein [Polyangiaceae bacterium]
MFTSAASSLPGTDEFIERCERVRVWDYLVRAAAQAELAPPMEAAGTAAFGSARVWFVGTRARVHLLNETSLGELEAIEDWLAERELAALFDVLPIVACRAVARVLGERGYRLVAWQPTLYRPRSTPIAAAPEGPSGSGIEVVEVQGESSEFRNTFMAGYEIPEQDRESAARIMDARWRAEGARRFLARAHGGPVAAATLVVHDGIARLANCATLPGARQQGAQAALIGSRLRCVAEMGLELAVSDARQGGSSLRNLVRAGFALGAHVTQWQRG